MDLGCLTAFSILNPLEVSSIPTPVTAKTVSTQGQMSPGGQNHPQLKINNSRRMGLSFWSQVDTEWCNIKEGGLTPQNIASRRGKKKKDPEV